MVSAISKMILSNSKMVLADSKMVSADSMIVSADSKIVSADSKIVSADSKMVLVDSKMVLAVFVVVQVSPLTLYRPSETVLIRFVFKLIFPKYKKNFKKFMTRKLFVREPFSFYQKV